MALRTAASPAHEVACGNRRSDCGKPLRERDGGVGLPEKTDSPKRARSVVDARDGAGRWGLGGIWLVGGDENGRCGC